MNRTLLLLFAMAGSLTGAEMEMLPAPPVAAFGGVTRTVQVVFRNRADQSVEAEIGREVYQATSATAAPVAKAPIWKKLQFHARQTVLEDVQIDLPTVRGETRFIVRFSHRGAVLGLQEVWVYPTNLLAELKSLPGDKHVILSDSTGSLKEVLTAVGARLVDSNSDASTSQTNQVMLFGALVSESAIDHSSKCLIEFIRLPAPAAFTAPAYQMVFTNHVLKVVAQESAVANLSADPWAQLRLLRMVKLAASHERFYERKPKTLNEP